MIKLLTGITGILIILACAKDELPEIIETNDENHLSITGSGARDGERIKQFFESSLTIWDDSTQTQTILNKDSLQSIDYAKIRTSKPMRPGVPHTGKGYDGREFRVIFHWKNGSTKFSDNYIVKDTSANIYSVTSFKSSIIGVSKYIQFKRTAKDSSYYDFQFLRNKKCYLYQINIDTIYLEKYLTAWHHPASSIFFLDHKL